MVGSPRPGLVAGLAERHSVPLLGNRQRGIEISVSFVPFVFTAVAFGPLAALVVGTLGNLADLRRPYLRWAVYTPARALTGAAAGLAAAWAMPERDRSFVPILVAVLFAGVAHLTVDVAINMSTLAIRGSASPFAYPKAMAPLFLIAVRSICRLSRFLFTDTSSTRSRSSRRSLCRSSLFRESRISIRNSGKRHEE